MMNMKKQSILVMLFVMCISTNIHAAQAGNGGHGAPGVANGGQGAVVDMAGMEAKKDE